MSYEVDHAPMPDGQVRILDTTGDAPTQVATARDADIANRIVRSLSGDRYAAIAWSAGDVTSLAPGLTEAEATEWLGRNEKHIRDRLVSLGHEVIEALLNQDGIPLENEFDNAVLACNTAGIELVQAKEEEIRGQWDWLSPTGDASDMSFDTQEEAAADAVDRYFSREEWQREAGEGDTRLGYDEWVIHQAEQFADEYPSRHPTG